MDKTTSTQDKKMTSSQTSRGSAGKNYSTYPLIPPAMQLGEQLHPCYFFLGGGVLMHPSPHHKQSSILQILHAPYSSLLFPWFHFNTVYFISFVQEIFHTCSVEKNRINWSHTSSRDVCSASACTWWVRNSLASIHVYSVCPRLVIRK